MNLFYQKSDVENQGCLFKTVSSRDAAVERTGKYWQRVLKRDP